MNKFRIQPHDSLARLYTERKYARDLTNPQYLDLSLIRGRHHVHLVDN